MQKFLEQCTEILTMLEESNTLDYIKIRSFSIKVIIWTVNRQPMDKKKIFARQTHLVLLWLALLYFADTVFLFFFARGSFMATLTHTRWLAPFFSYSICSFGISGLLLTDICSISKFYYYMCFDDLWSVMFGVTIAKILQLVKASSDG